MAKLIDYSPDKTEESRVQGYLFYFANGKDPDTLPSGADYDIVYSPSRYNRIWHTASYKIIRTPSGTLRAPHMVNGRVLEPNEITHFEKLLTEFQDSVKADQPQA
jgi:hypothetical protein